MSFLFPLGLLGLIGVPLLVLIYILKNKHTEQVIASTYLWTLSERFLKRRNPISRITGIVSLILQILAVTFISFAIAQPQITLRGAADDYVFILDGSGSMYFEQEGTTRFELGKAKIAELIDDSANGSSYTLICAGSSTGITMEQETEKKQALALLDKAELSATAADLSEARRLAQEAFTKNPSAKIYLVTDKSYESLTNVELVNVSSRIENYGVSDLAHTVVGESLVVTGKAISYESGAELALNLFVDTGAEPIEQMQTLAVEGGVETDFLFELPNVSFQSIKVWLGNEDALPQDQDMILYNVNSVGNSDAASTKILLVGDNTFFLETAFSALVGKDAVETLAAEEYDGEKTGYSLYVFDSYVPELLPDGAVWFINPTGSVADAGFNTLEEEVFGEHRILQYNESTSTRIQELLKEVNGDSIAVTKYTKCSFYRTFHTVLSHNGNPVVAAGTNSNNNRVVLFAFDFKESNFVLTFDFMTLIRNLWNYTSPSMITKATYECGETAAVNVFADGDSIRIDTPTGEAVYLDTGSDLAEYTLTEVGTYKITQMRGSVAQTAYIYGCLPKGERSSTVGEEAFAVEGTPSEERRDGIYNSLLLLLIILAAVYLADWVVYCYEQHQLR